MVHIRMNPTNVTRIMRIKIGWSSDAFDAVILSEISLVVFDRAGVGTEIPSKTITVGQRLYVSIEIDEGFLLFGDSEHRSAIELEGGLDLSGQPIPEFPLPVATLLITLILTFAIERLHEKEVSRR